MFAAKFLAVVVAAAVAAVPVTLRILKKKGLGKEPEQDS